MVNVEAPETARRGSGASAQVFPPEAERPPVWRRWARSVAGSLRLSPEAKLSGLLRSTPLFDADYYRQQAAVGGMSVPAGDAALTHWLSHGRAAGIVPTPVFDEAGYSLNHPDVAAAGAWPFEHFCLQGAAEGRNPNGAFDAAWWRGRHPQGRHRPAFFDYMFQLDSGALPSPAVSELIGDDLGVTTAAARGRLGWRLQALAAKLHLAASDFTLLVRLLDPNEGVDRGEAFAAFLESGLEAGQSPTLLFDRDAYAAELKAAGMDGPANFAHWLSHGRKAGLQFTALFDRAFYAAQNPDLQVDGPRLFEHFLTHGVWEGRQPNAHFADDTDSAVEAAGPGGASVLASLRRNLRDRGSSSHLARELCWLLRPPPGEVDDAGLLHLGAAARAAMRQHQLNLSELRFLAQVFDPGPDASSLGAFTHYLESGLGRQDPPSPLITPDSRGSNLQGGESGNAVAAWLRQGRWERVLPTALFDPRFYLASHDDLSSAYQWEFEHFLLHGIYERRDPSPWFATAWYEQQGGEPSDVAPYIRFLRRLASGGDIPTPFMSLFLQRHGEPDAGVRLDDYLALVVATRSLKTVLSSDHLRVLVLLFEPAYYRRTAGLPRSTSAMEALRHFLTVGLREDLPPSPVFDAAHYAAELRRLGHADIPSGRSPFLHWLVIGRELRVQTSPLFNEAYYLAANPDIAAARLWGFEHFITHGAHEGRLPQEMLDLPTAVVGRSSHAQSTYRKMFGNPDESEAERTEANFVPVSDLYLDANRIVRGEQYKEIFEAAQAIEPMVGDTYAARPFLRPPYHDSLGVAITAVKARLPRLDYEHVVTVPWVRMGGADLVGAVVVRALRRLRPDAAILILQTDSDKRDWVQWYPADCDLIDVSDLFERVGPVDAEYLLYTVLMGLGVKSVVNVNSNLCWRTLRRYGARLGANIKLFSYLFCWDQTAGGVRAGYPSDFFPETVGVLDRVLVDTEYLKRELTRTYKLPARLAAKILPLYTPADLPAPETPLVLRQVESRAVRRRPLILWAGRLDRQKRFDIAMAVARAMPKVDFRCWGSAVMDERSMPDLLPPNVTLEGAFKSYAELPLAACDGWLYTSAWDGLPTILLEIGALGMPVVASAVGGVPELIDEETGWSVRVPDDVSAYVSAVSDMLSDADERVRRACALQARVESRHREIHYDACFGPLLP